MALFAKTVNLKGNTADSQYLEVPRDQKTVRDIESLRYRVVSCRSCFPMNQDIVRDTKKFEIPIIESTVIKLLHLHCFCKRIVEKSNKDIF